jgi:hypothetical protein
VRAPPTCSKCEREAKLAEEKRQKEFALQQKRDAAQLAYAQKLAAIDAQIAEKKREEQERREEAQRSLVIKQKEKDLEDIKARVARGATRTAELPNLSSGTTPQAVSVAHPLPTSLAQSSVRSPAVTTSPSEGELGFGQTPVENPQSHGHSETLEIPASPARDEWQRQKDLEGADNEAIDAIMSMIGLEEVKRQVLDIKARIDTAARQGVSLKDDRFNITFLGNPGTGKVMYFLYGGRADDRPW